MPMDLVDRFIRPLRRGPRTRRYPYEQPVLAPAMRGLPEVDPVRCDADGACVAACPTGAIVLAPGTFTIDAGRCVFCAACQMACPQDAITLGQRFELATRTRVGLHIQTRIGEKP